MSKPRETHPLVPVALAAVALALVAFATFPAWSAQAAHDAEKKVASPALPVPNAAHALTASDVDVFLDGLMPIQLERDDIAGGVVMVVKDGQVLFTNGYGYADVKKKTPVTADGTLFRPGSISKLFTWTAVMQQVEQGKLDLDRDVNPYLDFKIPATYPQPITLRNLMTHTPGFEESDKNLIAKDPSRLVPLGQYLKDHIPARIFPPGPVPAYSNYGAALAGYIVERVSGRPFNRYVEESIFQPLDMQHASFDQPLPAALKPLMSSGYNLASDGAQPYEIIEDAPAGALAVSAQDIAHFMIAHLQDGTYNSKQILQPETARLMHARQSGPHPALNGMALGFYEQNRNGHRVIAHGGDTVYFHSELLLLLDEHVGLFVSVNSAGKGEVDPRSVLYAKFMDRYFPDPSPPPLAIATSARDAKLVEGSYMSSRRSETTILSMEQAFSQTSVHANSDGTISVDGLDEYSSQPKHLQEVAPLVFRDVNDSSRVAFRRDDTGNLVMVLDFPVFVFQHVPWYKNGRLSQGVFFGSLAIFALAVLFWPVAAILRWHYARPLELDPRERRLHRVTRVVAIINLALILAWIAYGSAAGKNLSLLSDSFDPWFRVMELLAVLGIVGMLAAVLNALVAWMSSTRWLWSKLGETAIALACVALTWFVLTWHMIVWSLNY